MKQYIQDRIVSLRRILDREGMSAFIIPSTDPHLSEYVAEHWKAREWISGFTGSAGTVVITSTKAGLWTDSRYFIQATEELKGSGIVLYKEMLPETPTIINFLIEEVPTGGIVGISGEVFATSEAELLEKELTKIQIKLATKKDIVDEVWSERPGIPQNPPYIYGVEYAGQTVIEKIRNIRRELEQQKCDSTLLSALDEIAWTLNLRGTDVKCNPVVISYLLITKEQVVFFIAPEKVTQEISNYLKENGVEIRNYNEVESYLSSMSVGSILLTPAKTNFAIMQAVASSCRILRSASPVALLKATRNEVEIAGVRNAMKRDGAALVKFLKWLEANIKPGKETEISIDQKLHAFRAEQPLYKGESFDTIAGYKEHGAIVHYSATPESNATLKSKGFLLLDSGAQYLDGTTDITRTIALGKLTEEERIDYTLVLKGHINLAMAKFPAGTRGAQLDVLARLPLWSRGMNYLHGTGHGIGHFLNVHEGPQSIRMNENPIILQPGMVTSNEPGVYKAGSHGVRIENLILVVQEGEGMYGNYYSFETITLCPICTKGVIKELLNKEEVEWFNNYHQKVYNELSPLLNDEEKSWLKVATQKL